jgi:DNA-binding LytR/AlgR family response regulator
MMKALIIEDEIPASKHLRRILNETGDIEVIGIIESISETVEWFESNHSPDLVFMDIHLADGIAFEIFNRVKIGCPVIFTTAYDEYALKAFKVNSIDYLLKPIEPEDVRNALKKLRALTSPVNMQNALESLLGTFRKTSKYKTHFLIPARGDKLIPVQISDLACFYIDSGSVKAVGFDGKSYRLEYTLDELSDLLDPEFYFRANRQYIISKSSVKDIDFWFNSRLSVNLKVTVPEKILISKARIQEFKNWYGGQL